MLLLSLARPLTSVRRASSGKLSLVVLLGLVLMCTLSTSAASDSSSHRQHKNQRMVISDQDIRRSIEAELSLDAAISAHLIDVAVDNGIVTLTGKVDNLLAKDLAANAAGAVVGVRSVVNTLSVMATPRADDTLKKDIQSALAADPATDLYETDVQVANGTVILSGKVESPAERQLVERVAKAVKGVKDVKNNVVVEPVGKRSDEEIAADVKGALKHDPWVNADSIDVEVKDGVVRLKGSVDSIIAKSHAINDAWVNNVIRVAPDSLTVKPGESTAANPPPPPSDDSIEAAIKSAFGRHPRLEPFELNAESEDSRITLEGTVDNFKAKTIAEDVAETTRGVVEVRNHIKVRPKDIPDDAVLANRIEEAFVRDPYVSRYNFNVSVRNAKVYLDGQVDSSFEKQWAEDIASRVRGVADIRNNLDVVDLEIPQKTDWLLKRDIENALDRSAAAGDSEIAINVKNGIATLAGTVDSWRARMAAERSARSAGAESVLNQIEVRYGTPTAQSAEGYAQRNAKQITINLSKAQIKRLEEELESKGYNPGDVDGVLDDKTQAALRSFQTDNALMVTGNID